MHLHALGSTNGGFRKLSRGYVITPRNARPLWYLLSPKRIENRTERGVVGRGRLSALAGKEEGPKAGEAVLKAIGRIEKYRREHPDAQNADWETAMRNNPWSLPPASVISKGRASLERFYKSWTTHGNLEEMKALKVVMVGTGGAGKTRCVPMTVLLPKTLAVSQGHSFYGAVVVKDFE